MFLKWISNSLISIVACSLLSCAPDEKLPLGVNDYFLRKNSESGVVYLENLKSEGGPTGVIEGTVTKMAMMPKCIVLELKSIYSKNGIREPEFYGIITEAKNKILIFEKNKFKQSIYSDAPLERVENFFK